MWSTSLAALAFATLFFLAAGAEDPSVKLNSIDTDSGSEGYYGCEEKDTSLSCQTLRIARNVFTQMIKAKKSGGIGDVKIMEGVELVKTQSLAEGGRGLNDGSALGRIAGFLESHELRIKLPDLVGRDEIKEVFSDTLRSFNDQNDAVETGRKKGKGGSGVLLMGLMMAKTLAAIGFGGLGMLTMKALMVSALALMLSAIIGIKKLASHDNDSGGHQVHYVQAHEHHRRRREAPPPSPLPYRGWPEYVEN